MTQTATGPTTYGFEAVREMWEMGIEKQVVGHLGIEMMVANEKDLPLDAHGGRVLQVPVRIGGPASGVRLPLNQVLDKVAQVQEDVRFAMKPLLGDHKHICFHPKRFFYMTKFQYQNGSGEWLARVLVAFIPVSQEDVETYQRERTA